MPLQALLETDLKAAMKAGDDTRKTTIRAVLSAARQAQLERREALIVEKRKSLGLRADDVTGLDPETLVEIARGAALRDDDYESALRREAKARREALTEAEQARRADLAAAQRSELAILEAYLPKQLSREEVAARAHVVIADMGASGISAYGSVMQRLMPELRGVADGKLVGDVVRELLSS